VVVHSLVRAFAAQHAFHEIAHALGICHFPIKVRGYPVATLSARVDEINLESFLLLLTAFAFLLVLFLSAALLLWMGSQPTLSARFIIDHISPFI
jgi:hypothetical protein